MHRVALVALVFSAAVTHADDALKPGTVLDATTAAGKDTTAMTASLTDLSAKIAATKVISDGFVAKLLALQPTDYNADHTILETYRTSLVTARTDASAAIGATYIVPATCQLSAAGLAIT